MKKVIIMVIALVLMTGFAMADRGIDPVPETQGITTATTLDLVGNAASTTDIQWLITDSLLGLDGIPPLGPGFAYYTSTYSEETFTNGVGLIAYDKNMDVETSEQLAGEWNIDADKQIEFVGVDGARAYSDEYIMVDGVGRWTKTELDVMLCPFAADVTQDFPAYCNFAESGSTIDMTVANVRTNSMDRFIVPSGDTTVELEHDIAVTELITDLPSMGSASAFMNVLIMEAYADPDAETLGERIEFGEVSSVSGDISAFLKDMNYVSGMRR
jgi:hypothetical protein